MLLVALGCGRAHLPGIFEITTRHPFVVFGAMDGEVLAGLAARIADSSVTTLPVYFYETG